MGWCQEFGPRLHDTCDHEMAAGPAQCHCPVCGTVCTGRFPGCAAVWAAAPARPTPAAATTGAAATIELAPPNPTQTSVGDVRSALAAIRAELDDLRAADNDNDTDTDAPGLPPLDDLDLSPSAATPPAAPSYDEFLDLERTRRRGPWWRRHRPQHSRR